MTPAIRVRRLLATGVLLLLAACASAPPVNNGTAPGWPQRLAALQATQHFQLQGRIAAANGNDGFSAGLRWQQNAAQASIDLSAALGLGAAHIELNDQDLLFTASNGVTLQGDAGRDALTANLGFEPPFKSLRFWVLGASDPGSAAEPTLDSQQRLQHLTQDGWSVDYEDYALVQQQWLPRRVTLTRGTLRLRLVVNSWQL